MPMIVLSITGTPGSGKTGLAKAIKKLLILKRCSVESVNLTDFARKNKLMESYDKKRNSMVVDAAKLNRAFARFAACSKADYIIADGHLSHFLNSDVSVVLRLRPDLLKKRLLKRKYSKYKINENVTAEILDIISAEAKEQCQNAIEINMTGKKPENAARRVLNTLCNKKYKSDRVNWMKKYQDYLK